MPDDERETDAADRQSSMFVGTFAAGPVSPIMRGTGGASAIARNNRLVWWLCGLALIPYVGLLFAALAILIAGIDVISGREHAWLALGTSVLALVVAFVIVALLQG
jgi:hypothetical protein